MSSDRLTASGLWPTFRRDEKLSGFQPLPGAIVRPAIAWKHCLGGPIFEAHVLRRDDRATLLLVYGGCLVCRTPDGALMWKSRALGIEAVIAIDDVDLDGRTEIIASNGKSLFVLDASDGSLLWQEYLGPPFAGGFMHTGALLHHFPQAGAGKQLAVGLLSSKEVMLYDFTPGAAQPERLHILWMDDFFHPSLLAADLDGDGLDELIVTKFSAVYSFDPATGEMKSECRWSSGGTPKRNYGLFAARDLNGDGALDLVVISDRVSRHIAVVENDGRGNLTNRWDRFLEHIYESDEKELRYTISSCSDIDGDGRQEVVASTFNDREDGRWWLEVIDAWSGEVRERLPDLYLRGIQQPRGDRSIVLASEARSRVPDEFSRIAMLEWKDGALRETWTTKDASFVGRFVPPSAHTALFRTELPPSDDVWIIEEEGVANIPIRRRDGSLALIRCDASRDVQEIPGTAGTAVLLAVADLDGDGRSEMVICDDRGNVKSMRFDGTVLGEFQAGMRLRPGTGPYYMAKPMQTPAVFEEGDDRYCAVPDGGSRIHLLRWNDERQQPEIVWAREGRGRIGPEEAHHSVVAAVWNGEPVVLMSDVGKGEAAMRAVNVRGEEVHRWVFADLPASPSLPQARIGIHEFALIERPAADPLLVVSGFRSPSMNSELTIGMNAGTHERLWKEQGIQVGDHLLGFGPWNCTSIIRDRNEPQLLFLAKDSVCHVDAATGELLHEPWQLRPFNTAHLKRRGLTMDDFSAYGSPVQVDVDADGIEEWLLMANYGGFGVINRDHTMRWWLSAPLSSLTNGFGGIADIDGDGLPELGLSFADGDFVCLRADTGEEKWRLHLGQVATGIVTCDIDGDGRIEFVFGTREGEVIALGTASNGSGLVKWRLDLGYTLGPVIAADFDGDGLSEILVVSGDGCLYQIASWAGV
jgi:outer membrane protein assembly factor BamB